MAVNRGKQFEDVIKEAFEQLPNVSIDRLHDQTNGYRGSSNICDFIVYRKPHEFYFECKSVHGNTLSIHSTDPKHCYGNITNKQWEGLSEKALLHGVHAGVICWWIDRDVTLYIPIKTLQLLRENGCKSVNYKLTAFPVLGTKKRVFFDYDVKQLLDDIEKGEL